MKQFTIFSYILHTEMNEWIVIQVRFILTLGLRNPSIWRNLNFEVKYSNYPQYAILDIRDTRYTRIRSTRFL